MEQINANVNTELNKIGLEIINVNIKDITDESGYIDAIGKKLLQKQLTKQKLKLLNKKNLVQLVKLLQTKKKKFKLQNKQLKHLSVKQMPIENNVLKLLNLKLRQLRGKTFQKQILLNITQL